MCDNGPRSGVLPAPGRVLMNSDGKHRPDHPSTSSVAPGPANTPTRPPHSQPDDAAGLMETVPPAPPGEPEVITATVPPSSSVALPASAMEYVSIPGYEVLRELGRGGMGVVYQARHLRLQRTVALKMILSGSHASQADLVRFLAEAEAVAQLQHPNIVQLFETGQHQNLPYFTLEYVSGGSLAEMLQGRPLPPPKAARLIEQLARAVHFAHQHGIIHRDLKPANVMLAEDGTPKVTDFGLAKRVEGGSGLTATGVVMGTPSYMAPEQAEGKREVGP